MRKPKKHHDQDRAAARRQQVLDAAWERFLRHGFHNTSMAEISRASGMSVGHIYNYFTSKEAVIVALCEQEMTKLLARFRETAASRERFVEEMKAILREQIAEDSNACQAALVRDLLAEMGRNDTLTLAIQNFDRSIRAEISAICRLHKPDWPEHLIRSRTEVLLVLLHGYGMRGIVNPDINVEDYTKEIEALIEHMFAEPGGKR